MGYQFIKSARTPRRMSKRNSIEGKITQIGGKRPNTSNRVTITASWFSASIMKMLALVVCATLFVLPFLGSRR
jgi:hypothetical protein